MEGEAFTKDGEQKSKEHPSPVPMVRPGIELVRELFSISGSEALKRVLDLDDPERIIQEMSRVDFFWLIKKIGEEESLPILNMASPEQWEYILDMELWERDRIDLDQATHWLGRMRQADPGRFVAWLISHGESIAYCYFFKSVHVEVRNKDEAYDLADEYMTLDGIYYFRILDKEREEIIKQILQDLAREDYERYQALLLGLMGTSPAELEEEMYRVRNVRLSEEGFLPFEEALSAYAYLRPDSLKREPLPSRIGFPATEEDKMPLPVTPLFCAEGDNLLTLCARRVSDPLFFDRIRLEFAGLCNRLLSAEGQIVRDMDLLMGVCRKAAGLINLGLEKASGGEVSVSEEVLRNNHLASIFRVGFSLALELRWETERWLKQAWFIQSGFKADFWEDEWGGTLSGILQKRPRLFSPTDGEIYKDFENLGQLEACRLVVNRLKVLDRLIGAIASLYPLEAGDANRRSLTFQPLLFTFWARKRLGIQPGFGALSVRDLKEVFELLRSGDEKPPYRMSGFRKAFVEDLRGQVSEFEPEAVRLVEGTLDLLWEKFVDEYAWVGMADLDARFVKFIVTQLS